MDDKFFKDAMKAVGLPVIAIDENTDFSTLGNPFDHCEDDGEPRCTNAAGHEWACSGTQYGGDDESFNGEGRCYCVWCGADGDA